MKKFLISEYNRLKPVFLTCSMSMIFVAFRMKISHDLHYLFLVWNLFLAIIPLVMAYWLRERKPAGNKTLLVLILLAWLLFLPNAPYILTDFIHLSYSPNKWFLFDLLMISGFTFSGLVSGLISVKIIQNLFMAGFSEKQRRLAEGLIFLLCGYGIYLGRFWRYNSWYLVTDPFRLIKDCFATLVHPVLYWQVWLFTLIFGTFLHVVYFFGTAYFLRIHKNNAYANEG